MRYNGVYSATRGSAATVTTAAVLMELQVPAGTQIELIRAWVSPAETLTDDIQQIQLYLNDAAATGGASWTEQEIQGVADGVSGVVALSEGTVGASVLPVIMDSFHLQQGWLYLPMDDERIRVSGGSAVDNVGMRFPVAPASSIDITFGMLWGEIG